MITRRNPVDKIPVLFFVVLMLMAAGLPADVIYLKDGSIIIARFKAASGDTMVYTTGGGEIDIPSGNILRTEPDLSALTGKQVELEMFDKSVIEGTFTDYDEDIGYFIDLSFGTLTVPGNKVLRMTDPVQTRKYQGADVSLSARGVFYVPIANENFLFLAGGGLGTEVNLPFMRGLFAGVDLEFIALANGEMEDLNYMFIQISPKVVYRYLGFRVNPGFMSRIVPFAVVGGGLTVVFIQDLRDGVYPDSYGALSPHAKVEAGVDVYILENLSLKINGSYMVVFQKEELFQSVGGCLSVSYEF
jgi:hypothetical protein